MKESVDTTFFCLMEPHVGVWIVIPIFFSCLISYSSIKIGEQWRHKEGPEVKTTRPKAELFHRRRWNWQGRDISCQRSNRVAMTTLTMCCVTFVIMSVSFDLSLYCCLSFLQFTSECLRIIKTGYICNGAF